MVNTNTNLEANWPYNHRRQIRREKEERIGRCVRQITRSCKGMLRRKLEDIEAFNSLIRQDKLEKNKCFYCREKGHLIRTCPKNIMDDAESSHKYSIASLEKEKENNIAQPEVTLKYPEFIYFNTNGILKGTYQGSWDDFWYLSKSSDKHVCSNLNMFCNINKKFLVNNLEDQKKFLFTYGMGDVIIKHVFQAYLIPGVYFAPEVSLNILSIDLLNQQGFEVVSDGDRYRLEYMFKESTGNIIDLNKLRQMQNSFIENYFEGLNQNQDTKKDEMARYEEDVNPSEVHTFQEFVGFLNLIQNDDVTSAPFASQKGKEKIEHFGIKLEDKENCKEQQTAHHEEDQTTCYRCHNFGHYAYQCLSKLKNQGNYKSYKEPSTSKIPVKGKSSKDSSSEDLNIIT
ncbi:ARID DNA-binding domain-containing protein [Tanacetum coccineum]